MKWNIFLKQYNPMNILHITLGFPPAYSWGGPVKTVSATCRELVCRGHKVTVYCSNLFNKGEKIRPVTFESMLDGIRVVYFNAWNISSWPGTLGPIWLPEMPKYLRKEIHDFDIIHIQGYRSLMHIPAARAARKAGVPFVVQPRGSMPIIVNSFFAKRLYDVIFGRREIRGLAALIALQESEVHQALTHGVPRERIHVIPNGVEPSLRSRLPLKNLFRKKHFIRPDEVIILFAARINAKKGADMLVDAVAQLDIDRPFRVVIAGPDDGQLAEVRNLIEKHRIGEKFLFTGLLSHQEILEAFVDADLYVLPCRADTFPMAIIEACLTDTPMVTTDRCEIAHMVKDRIAQVVPFNPKAFALALKTLCSDQNLYETCKINCRQVLEDTFSIKNTVDKLEVVYRRIISEKHP